MESKFELEGLVPKISRVETTCILEDLSRFGQIGTKCRKTGTNCSVSESREKAQTNIHTIHIDGCS